MSPPHAPQPVESTFHGLVWNTDDALVLFKACLQGLLPYVPRRPCGTEYSSVLQSGNVFIWEEGHAGIKRWTDGVPWSPSRIMGNFLIYREVEKPIPRREKRRVERQKRDRLSHNPVPQGERDHGYGVAGQQSLPRAKQHETDARDLFGSLIENFDFKKDGLVKKTIGVSVEGHSWHLVSYYDVEDVRKQVLVRPRADPRLCGMTVRPELYFGQKFRVPFETPCELHADSPAAAHTLAWSIAPAANPAQAFDASHHQWVGQVASPGSRGRAAAGVLQPYYIDATFDVQSQQPTCAPNDPQQWMFATTGT